MPIFYLTVGRQFQYGPDIFRLFLYWDWLGSNFLKLHCRAANVYCPSLTLSCLFQPPYIKTEASLAEEERSAAAAADPAAGGDPSSPDSFLVRRHRLSSFPADLDDFAEAEDLLPPLLVLPPHQRSMSLGGGDDDDDDEEEDDEVEELEGLKGKELTCISEEEEEEEGEEGEEGGMGEDGDDMDLHENILEVIQDDLFSFSFISFSSWAEFF